MRFGRAVAAWCSRIPGCARAVGRLQNRLRARRARRRAARIATASAPIRDDLPARARMGGWSASPGEYAWWIATHEPERRLPQAPGRRTAAGGPPLISVLIPVYRVKPAFLRRMLESLRSQTFSDWEACIVCADPEDRPNRAILDEYAARDPRFRVLVLPDNLGISGNSNAALEMATGEFVALLDHDDELAPFALGDMASAAAATPDADFFYSDKDSIDEDSSLRQNALFKPEWSPEILFSVNYLTHFNVMRTRLVREVGGFRPETDGAQDWDIFLRVCHRARRIVRVPGVHYHWRIHAASTSTGLAAKPYASQGQLRALQDHVERLNLPATVEPCEDSGFHLCWKSIAAVSVHVVIDGLGLPEQRLAALVDIVRSQAAGFRDCAITVLVDREERLLPGDVRAIACQEDTKVHVINQAISHRLSETTVLMFVAGRVETISDDGFRELAGWVSGHHDIGFASALVLDAQGDVVEAGLVVDQFGEGSPMFRGSPLRRWGWFGGPLWYRNCSASSPWLVAVNADAWVAAGGFDERLDWQHAFIAACRSISRCGKRGVVVPHARGALDEAPLPGVPPFHASLRDDPYFHPAFSAVVPLSLAVAAPTPAVQPRRRTGRALRVPRLSFRRPRAPASTYEHDALVLSRIIGCSAAELAARQQHPERLGRGPGSGWCNWYIPPFENAFYGGIMTILRFAEYLHRTQRIRQRFLVCGHCDREKIGRQIVQAFPGLADSEVLLLDSQDAIARIPPADYSVATLWTTAYVLLTVRNTALKFYFIQDWEPLFYPAGSTYAQAQLTYDFGFYGIANTRTLRLDYEREHNGRATHFAPQVDPAVFHGTPLRDVGGPKRLFFYGRPGHPRNGFELAVAAIRQVKERLGDRVQILCAGAPWDPRRYGLDGMVESLGVLKYHETADLYRSCHIGFSMMMTRHPSYLPFEFMACGGLFVSNDNRANHWLLADGKNCLLAPASAPAIAERLVHAVEEYDSLMHVRRAGWETIRSNHCNWDRAFADVAEFMRDMAMTTVHSRAS